MIRLIDAEKIYDNGTHALKGVSFTVDDGEFAFLEECVKLRACVGIAPHIILILYPVYRIRIKQHGNVSLFRIGIRKINGRFARKCKRHHIMLLLLLCGKDAPC